jgi:RHS repeat-associated protein
MKCQDVKECFSGYLQNDLLIGAQYIQAATLEYSISFSLFAAGLYPEKPLYRRNFRILIEKEFDRDGEDITTGTDGSVRVHSVGLRLNYHGKRYYDSEIGMWTSKDPNEQYHSPFVYCGNNPIKMLDPDGKEAYIYSRSVQGTGDMGRHMFAVITEPSGSIKNIISLQGSVSGIGDAQVNYERGFANDREALMFGNFKDVSKISPPVGVSQLDFERAIVDNASSYFTDYPNAKDYPALGGVGQSGAANSNTFVNRIFEDAGATVPAFDKAINQKAGE